MIAPGTSIGRYEVVSFLAAGGMGEVYRGRDAKLGRAVAIKVLSQAAFKNAEAIERFEREARAAAAVSHPNLVSIYDVGCAGDLHYLVMDLLEGQNLRQRLAMGALPWATAVEIGIAAAAGIGAVHAKGFVHRDLKPENIFITAEGWVKLLDFGLAAPPLSVATLTDDQSTMRALTVKGTLVGTLSYMSPEQLREEELDARADVFALGCVLYEMLAGQVLFQRNSIAETIAAILADGKIDLPPSVPSDLLQLVRRCLVRARTQRFQSADELGAALRAVGGGAVPQTRSPEAGPSIAVLPFANLSGDKENDYFGDGLSEEILTALMRIPGLKVTARTSALAFRGKDVDVRAIGEALGVRSILEGGVRRAGNQVRVTAQLVDAASGYHLWSGRYDRAMTDVFAVQDEIAAAIVDTLHLRLVTGQRMRVPHTANVNAYHAYLKSRYHFSKLTPENLALSQALAAEAIALDPEYPAAQAQLAECFIQAAIYGLKPAHEMVPLAREAALKAVAFDASEPSAQMTLARIAGEYDLDWPEALRRCRLALASDRISPAIRALCAQFVLLPLGHIDELTAVIQPSLASDPLSPMPRFVLAQGLLGRGQFERTLPEIRSVLELHEHFWPGHNMEAMIHMAGGRTAEAIAALEKSLRVAPWNVGSIGLLAGNYERAGDHSRGERLMAKLAVRELAPLAPLGQAAFHFVTGDYDRVAEHYSAVIEMRYPVAAYYLTVLSLFDPFHESQSGRMLRQRMNLL